MIETSFNYEEYEKNRIARAKTTAEFGGALFDFDSPLKKEEEEEVPA